MRSKATELRAKSTQLLAVITEEAGDAATSAKNAKDEAGAVTKEARQLRQQVVATEATLSAEHDKRMELEQSLAPRIIPLEIRGDKTSNFDELKPFAGTEVAFEVLPDAEAVRAAGEVEQLLKLAGWTIGTKSYNANINAGYFDGVLIKSRNLPGRIMGLPWNEETRRENAGDSLNCLLIKNKWLSRVVPAVYGEPLLPPNKITIMIGFKPNTFFDPDWAKSAKRRAEEIECSQTPAQSFPRK